MTCRFAGIVGCLLLLSQGISGQERLSETINVERQKTLSALSAPTTWENALYQKNKDKTKVLLNYIAEASVFGGKDVACSIIDHIGYSPYEDMEVGFLPLKEEYPVA